MAIEKAMEKAPAATWVLVNPLLEDTVDAYTFGPPPLWCTRALSRSLSVACFLSLARIFSGSRRSARALSLPGGERTGVDSLLPPTTSLPSHLSNSSSLPPSLPLQMPVSNLRHGLWCTWSLFGGAGLSCCIYPSVDRGWRAAPTHPPPPPRTHAHPHARAHTHRDPRDRPETFSAGRL
jgi:hypothetical protein